LALAAGEAEWKPYLTTLAQTKRARWILLEHVKDHAPANLAADAATLHRWLQDL